jgi:hypothetical protein
MFGQKCKSTQRCPLTLYSVQENCINKTKPVLLDILPGEKAVDASECLSKKMEGTYCVGLSQGNTCTSHAECDVGLICSTGPTSAKTCNKAKMKGEQCNNFELICASGLYCDQKDYVCEYFGTDKVGDKVGTVGHGIECESFLVDPKEYWTCIKPMARTTPQFMDKGAKCTFSYTSATLTQETFTADAACGLLKNGSAICDPDYSTMDEQRATFVNYLKNDNKTLPCHVYSLMPFCEEARQGDTNFMNAVKAFFDLNLYDYEHLFVTTVNVESCFYDVNRLYYFGGVEQVSVLFLLVLLVLL